MMTAVFPFGSREARGAAARAFFHTEYQLNHRLFAYAKPTVAFMDGVTMGGDGVSQIVSRRLPREDAQAVSAA